MFNSKKDQKFEIQKYQEYGFLTKNDNFVDWHIHTDWSDGHNTLEEMIIQAIKIGRKKIGITDHAKGIMNGLDEKKWIEQHQEILKLREKYKNQIEIKHGIEANINMKGEIDWDFIEADLDFCIGAIHHSISKCDTERLLKVINNKMIDILAHPTNRLIGQREGSPKIDWELILEALSKNDIALEFNSQPSRFDAPANLLKRAVKKDIRISLASDAHDIFQLSNIEKYSLKFLIKGNVKKENILV